ncbi:alpha-hydroxy acid oxidase [Actinacidiphila acididurans]|uniref:Alpha-hydroxy-acid oxidizing protein n=1 Tax=Actinacidiphila acididurans TaxID=2784346 RepID=A0ABS2U2K5_9ACTN|nr:alpha-hydroxy acid oxidase [Actinacidiphila acididurans]MBM9509834.1 alpha-hydroxy-acid oxidizing protein [Actinacidiphila acididurans]
MPPGSAGPAPAPGTPGGPLTVADVETAARGRLPADVWDFIEGGSRTEWTLAANRAQFGHWALRPRVLVDVSDPDPSVELFGDRLAAPLAVAPMAYHELAHEEGELATARAAAAEGVPLVVAAFAGRGLEEIATAAGGGAPLWLQLYWLGRKVVDELADRAAVAGYRALVVTADAPRVARRLRDVRNSFAPPPHIRAVNVDGAVPPVTAYRAAGASAIEAQSRDRFDPSVTWADLARLRERTRLPVVLKGVLTAEDARLAVEHGCAAVIVSNHGGRQLDGALPSLAALPEVAEAVAGRIPVLLDGGIRHGSDIAKALALGAQAVLVGRPVLWGLACAGAPGAAGVLRLLREEFEEAMTLAGRPRATDFTRTAVTPWPPPTWSGAPGFGEAIPEGS